MKCPYCVSRDTKVVDKRDNLEEGTTRRRRECLKCEKRFTTYERIEMLDLSVVKKDGSIQKFNREKLKSGILKSFKKDPNNEGSVEQIVDEIERMLLGRQNINVKTTEISNMVLTRLKKINKIAYLRFASICKDLNSVQDFAREVASVK